MGFFDFLKSRPKSFEDAEKDIEARSLESLSRLAAAVQKDIESIREALALLGREKSVHPKTTKAHESMKNEFVKKALDNIKNVNYGDYEKSFDGFYDFIESVSAMVNSAVKVSPKQMVYIKFFYGEGVSRFTKVHTLLFNNISEMKSILTSPEVSKIRKIRSNLHLIEKTKKELENMAAKKKEAESRVTAAGQEAELKKGETNITIGSESYNRLIKMIEQQNSMRGEIAARILSARRVLVKYSHASGDKKANMLADRPYETYAEDREKCRQLLEKAVSMAQSGSIEVQTAELESARELLENFSELGSTMHQITEMEKSIETERHNLENEERQKHERESRIYEFMKAEKNVNERKKELEIIESELENVRRTLNEYETENERLKNGLVGAR
jgi:hypothetical protein